MLEQANEPAIAVRPRLFIVPHAAYAYSGPVAASAYRCLPRATSKLVVVGPSHFVAFPGLATPGVDGLATPLGVVPCDAELTAAVEAGSVTAPNRTVHAREHSVEVQLPFLQTVLEQFSVLTLLTGEVTAVTIATLLEDLIRDDEVVVLVSSDLSHYQNYYSAQLRDNGTADSILALRPGALNWGDACGLVGVQAGLLLADRQGWECSLLDLRSSGDTAGDRHSVVGYGSFVMGPAR
jgi:AmmeMemoRadiSam system protein B